MNAEEKSKLNDIIDIAKKDIKLLEKGQKDNVRHILETCSQIKYAPNFKIKRSLISKLDKEYTKM